MNPRPSDSKCWVLNSSSVFQQGYKLAFARAWMGAPHDFSLWGSLSTAPQILAGGEKSLLSLLHPRKELERNFQVGEEGVVKPGF